MAREESEFVLKSDFGVTLAGGLAGGEEEEEEAAGEGSREGVGGGNAECCSRGGQHISASSPAISK